MLVIDPNGSTICPSFYDSSGSLVLGYNAISGAIVYNSTQGTLFKIDDSYYAYLTENTASPLNYTLQLNQIGGNETVPYLVTFKSYNVTAPISSYAGILTSESTLSIQNNLTSEGVPVQTLYLSPEVIASENSLGFDIYAIPYTSDGALSTANAGSLIINGTNYALQELNSSAFEGLTPYVIGSSVTVMVYLFSPGLAGGYASV